MKMFNKLTAIMMSLFLLATTGSLIAGGDVPNPAKEFNLSSFVAKTSPIEFGVNLTWLLGDEANSIPTAGFNITKRSKVNGQVVEKLVETIKVNSQKEFKVTYTGFQTGESVQYLVTSFAWDAKQKQIFGKIAESKWIVMSDGNPSQEFIKVKVEAAAEMKVGEKRTYPIIVETNIKGGNVKFSVKGYNDMELLDNELDAAKPSITVWSDKEGYKALVIVATITNSNGKAFTSEAYIKTKVGDGNTNDKPYINFVDVPPVVKVTKGKEFTMQFKYKSNLNCLPTFKILKTNLPDGSFKFDAAKGVFTFTPSDEPINPMIYVQANIECNGLVANTFANVTFEMFDDVAIKEMGSVSCGLTDKENPNPEIEGVAYLYPLTKVANMEKVFKVEFKNNSIFFKGVPAGIDYKLQVMAKGYKMQWNVDASEMTQAQSFTVTPNGVKLAMQLTKIAPIKMQKVAGVCLDENDAPVKGATVQFYPYEVFFGGNGNKQDLGDIRTTVMTGDDGKYVIELPENGVFIAQAINSKPTSNAKKPQIKYYNNVVTPLEADIIFVDGEITGIDFKFDAAVTTKTGGFAGQVNDSLGAPIMSTLTAVQVLPGNNSDTKGRVYNSKTDDKGNFTFEGMEYGKYVVLSLPIEKKYLPGFLSQDGLVSQKWKEATQIEVNEVMTRVIYVARHKELPIKQGAGDVSGFVNGKKGIAFKKDNGIEAVETITGAMVYLENQNGQVVDYSFTEKTGQFAMTQLEDGIYNLVSDAVGFIPSSAQVVINYKTSPSAKAEVTLDMEAIASVETELNSSDLVVFPVPANADVTLSFTGLAGKATVNVLSMTGGVVLAQEMDVQTGLNISKFDFSNLSAGSYIVTINNNGRMLARTINVIR